MMIDFTVGELIEQTRRKDPNPGGGAITSLIGNLGVNLLFMMDKKTYEDENLEKKAQPIRKRLMEISKELEGLMQEDIDRVRDLIDAYKNGEEREKIEKKTLDAIEPPRKTIDLALEALEISDFILENGTKGTISDGEIGTRLLKESVMSSIINIEINQNNVDYSFDKEKVIGRCETLFDRNIKIIEGRKN